jgi:hypothetical protein
MFNGLLSALRRLIHILFGRRGPQNPLAGVGAPTRTIPGGRSSSIAVAEPDEPHQTTAIGARRIH